MNEELSQDQTDPSEPSEAKAVAPEPVRRSGIVDPGAVLPFLLMTASLAVLYGITAWVVSPQVERWIGCRAAFPWLSGVLLVLHHAVGTAGFSVVWAVSLLLLCSQVGGRQFRLMMLLNLLLCALAAAGAAAALVLQAQRCG